MTSPPPAGDASPPPVSDAGHSLHGALLEAHAADDHERLVHLYVRAADRAERTHDIGAACFFLTQAWVLALQAGSSRAAPIRERLARHGRV